MPIPFFEQWNPLLQEIDRWIWQPLFLLLTGAGLYLTFRLKGLQFSQLVYSLKLAFSRKHGEAEGTLSHFQALMTALAATIGIGNIAGVATAIAVGGLGALFWLWVTAFIGMIIKYGEAILAVRYRSFDAKGEVSGGPMYYLSRGLGWRGAALLFALFGAITALFTGNIVQSQSISSALEGLLHISPWVTGAVLAVSTGLVLLGGVRSIGKVTSWLVPFMAIFYILGALAILILRFDALPAAFTEIFRAAFTGQAAFGGFAGASLMLAMQMGVARGVFSNESGLGSAPIAAAAAKTDFPGRQALISMTGAFLSTIVCTFTGLVIAVTGMLGQRGPDGLPLNGAPMTIAAFQSVLPFGGLIVLIGSLLFGYSTIIGWAYYGEKCVEYLAGRRSVVPYRLLFSLLVFLGVFIPLDTVWTLADIANGLMALPNLLGVLALSGVVVAETKRFFGREITVV